MDKLFKFGRILLLALSVSLGAHADSKKVEIIVSLDKYQVRVVTAGLNKTYFISFGGPETYANSCAYLHGNFFGFCPPAECSFSAPPMGLWPVVGIRPFYFSGLFNIAWRDVIFFKSGYIIRAMTHDFDQVGKPTFTCGAIALLPQDARELFNIVSSVETSDVSVLIQ